MTKENRVTPEEAAQALQMNVESVRFLLREERLPIGYALQKPKAKRWTYYIFKGLLDAEVARLNAGAERKW